MFSIILLAAPEWTVQRTGMGFCVRTRKNVFHDDDAAALARLVAQREALVQAIAHELRLSDERAAPTRPVGACGMLVFRVN